MHEILDRIKDKNKIANPDIIAPTTLVAAKVTPKRISDVKAVPRIPVNKTGKIRHIQIRGVEPRESAKVTKIIARKTTEIPSKTHKNAGARVIVAEKVKNAAIIPIMMLPKIARIMQFGLNT